ncbi:MAG: threonine--tRNA ligase [Firmicutes bacterium]|nr:threonine--tRNA ligase [Bacillota bacterium]
MIEIILPDGSAKQVTEGSTVLDVAKQIGPRLAKAAVAGRINDQLVDLSTEVKAGDRVAIVTVDSAEGLEILRHSTAHVMAQAVKRLYPEAKLAIGPAIENGFYYDFDLPEPLSVEQLAAIEAEMERIVREDLPFRRMVLSKEEADRFFAERGEEYKRELVREIPDETVSLYQQGEFVDLCRGPHLPSTKAVKAFKLQSVAGAYWRGDATRPMLQRIYGLAFPRQEQLAEHLRFLEEAAKRDHRKLGKELDLFSLRDEGPGFPFIHPKGMIIWNTLLDFWREVHRKRDYQEIRTPIILNENLWRQSGHWDHYKENMYFTTIDGAAYAIKPMNCPGSMLLYGRQVHSYRDLPLRVAELGLVHRHELSGALHGLMRVRSFTQDDAHIFMLPEQIQAEIEGVIDLINDVYSTFGFNYHMELSTKPENAMGSDEIWELATNSLRNALEARGLAYKVNEGDGAFYGPKIDFHLEDAIGRTWQCGTIQLDFLMPERFDLYYIGKDNEKHRPVMIHRVVFGSIERFLAILVEHFAGAFPTWLAPIQVEILPVSDKFNDYAAEVAAKLSEAGIRVHVDNRDEKVSYKIREAQLQKVPYMLIVGEKEQADGTVAVRSRANGDQGAMDLATFMAGITNEIAERKLELTW